MKDDEVKSFALASRLAGEPAPVLTGVQAEGRVDGVLFELTLRQSYRNTSERVLEVVYTFPLPHQAVMLGFASELNGQRQVGTIVAKREAERRYEAALAEGDAPVMLEALPDGLHTANLGNLKPCDEIVLEVRYAQWLGFEAGRLRLAIPTTIAPRYGDAEQAGLQPQQVPQASMLAQYPLALSVTLAGSLGTAAIECPTHRFQRTAVDGGLRLALEPGAWLDRDVVLVVTPQEPRPSLLVQARDDASTSAPHLVMAAFQPPAAARRPQIALKLLVDCSGSMGGDSIESARRALQGAVQHLHEADWVSLSRFGSTVDHVLRSAICTPITRRSLKAAIDTTDATLGGTEMEGALTSVFSLPVGRDQDSADVLLITDGEIWQADEMIEAARASGHRVFAIGVGSSPAEAVLRQLAEATGGACEFATPGEALEAAAGRMMERIRQHRWGGLRIEWGAAPVWTSPLPASVFAGDTLIALAGFSQALPKKVPVRLMAPDGDGRQAELARGEAEAPCPGDTLARLAASRRLVGLDEEDAQALAVTYQLMGPSTNCVLVHERAEADKAAEAAELHRVSSMMAAGWGATGNVRAPVAYDCAMSTDIMFCLPCDAAPQPVASVGAAIPPTSPRRIDSEDYQIRSISLTSPHDALPASLHEIALLVTEHLVQGGQPEGLPSHCRTLKLHPLVIKAKRQVDALGLGDGAFWVLLARWVIPRVGGMLETIMFSELGAAMLALDPVQATRALQAFDQLLGGCDVDTWSPSREQRLRLAMQRP